MNNHKEKIAVLGTGSWGTALACLLSNNGHDVSLWSHSKHHLDMMKSEKENSRFLPGFTLPKTLKFSASLAALCKSHQKFLIVVPSRAFEQTLDKLIDCGLQNDSLIMWGTKGFDKKNKQLLSSLIDQKITFPHTKGIISGPSFALEVMKNLPTAMTAGACNTAVAQQIAQLFHNDFVRVYANTDLAGVQIGGAVKNVLAIACGISDGLGFGSNARSALITRGLKEISRLGEKLGANSDTFQGLSGLGDIVLTCTDDKSRNRRLGLGIGLGKNIDDITSEIGQEVEGLVTCKEVIQIAQKHHVSMPICQEVYNIIYKDIPPKLAVKALFDRNINDE